MRALHTFVHILYTLYGVLHASDRAPAGEWQQAGHAFYFLLYTLYRRQENGNKLDTRWLVVSSAAEGEAEGTARGMVVAARGEGLPMQTHHFAMDDFDVPADLLPPWLLSPPWLPALPLHPRGCKRIKY